VLGVSDSKHRARICAALAAVGLFVAVPASAQARKLYINVQLGQGYVASLPTGQRWQSTAAVSAYYVTTTQALSSGDGTLQLTPVATRGAFTASLSNPMPSVPLDCTWHGAPGGGHRLAQLQDGTPFAHAVSIQWPGYPGMWDQTLNRSSTGPCPAAFTDIPLQGEVTWALTSAGGTGGGNHFIFAAVPRSGSVEDGTASASVAPMTMSSLLTRSDGASYAVSSQGFVIESTVPFAGRGVDLPAPAVSAGGTLRRPLSVGALHRLALTLVPRRIPKGCVASLTRRRRHRCP